MLKELCTMMKDHSWICNISDVHSGSRYVLWLSSDTAGAGEDGVAHQLTQLRDYVEDRAD